jgi:uncharacterized Tic20 family protein
MEFYINIAVYYFLISFIVLLVNCFLAGLNNSEPSLKDLFDSLFWVFSGMVVLGVLTRALIEAIKK